MFESAIAPAISEHELMGEEGTADNLVAIPPPAIDRRIAVIIFGLKMKVLIVSYP